MERGLIHALIERYPALLDLEPWHLVSDEEFDVLFNGINGRYPSRRVVPFARRDDNDDVACFVIHDPDQVSGQIIVIHDFASTGWEVVARMAEFADWLEHAARDQAEVLAAADLGRNGSPRPVGSQPKVPADPGLPS